MTDERITEEYVYEYWDCPRCGNKGIRGDFRLCAQCGYGRGNDITFYRKEVDEVVTDDEQIEDFKKGPDWVCSYCGSMISQKEGKCKGCGVARDDSVKNYFDLHKDQEGEFPAPDEMQPQEEPPPPEEPEEKGSFLKKLLFIGGGIAAIIGILIFWGTRTEEIEYKVKSVHWERLIPIERYQWITGSDWQDEIRGDDIKELSRSREIRRYEKRQVGTRSEQYTVDEKYQSGTKEECRTTYKSTGSGAAKKVKRCRDVPVYSTRKVTKTRQVPVYREFPIYDTKVTYRAKKYKIYKEARETGNDNNPKWPAINMGKGADAKPDREGKRKEINNVTIVRISGDKGPKEAQFTTLTDLLKNKYIVNQKVKIKVNNLGKIVYSEGEKEIKVIK